MAGDAGIARVVGRSPWALAGRRLLRNRIAIVALAGFLVILAASLAAGWYAATWLIRAVRVDARCHDDDQRQAVAGDGRGDRRPRSRRHPHRPHLGCPPLLPRRRRPGPRRRSTPALRRSQLAPDRRRLGGALLLLRDHHRARGRLLRRHRRPDPVAHPRRHLGVPGFPRGDLDLDRRAHARHHARPDHARPPAASGCRS